MKITISMPEDVFKDLDDYRKDDYPHLKKVSRMFLQIVMDHYQNAKKENK
jgi:hypothetical protein